MGLQNKRLRAAVCPPSGNDLRSVPHARPSLHKGKGMGIRSRAAGLAAFLWATVFAWVPRTVPPPEAATGLAWPNAPLETEALLAGISVLIASPRQTKRKTASLRCHDRHQSPRLSGPPSATWKATISVTQQSSGQATIDACAPHSTPSPSDQRRSGRLRSACNAPPC